MGNPMSGMFGGGGDKAKALFNAKATARNQAAANSNAQQAFTKDYMSRFGQMNGYQNNLSGFYGGQGFPAIAQNYAKLNAYQPSVKRVMSKPGGGGSDIMGMLDPMGGSQMSPFGNLF